MKRAIELGCGMFLAAVTVTSFVACGSDPATTTRDSRNLAPFVENGPPEPDPDLAKPPTPPDMAMPADSCGSIDEYGTCSSDTLEYCNSGMLVTQDCTMLGQTCSVDPNSGQADCVDGSSGGGSCGSIDDYGVCNSNVAEWCDDYSMTLMTEDCTSEGLTCYFDPSYGAYCDY